MALLGRLLGFLKETIFLALAGEQFFAQYFRIFRNREFRNVECIFNLCDVLVTLFKKLLLTFKRWYWLQWCPHVCRWRWQKLLVVSSLEFMFMCMCIIFICHRVRCFWRKFEKHLHLSFWTSKLFVIWLCAYLILVLLRCFTIYSLS